MVFHLIGLGLGDVEDITVKGLNIIRRCSKVYLESYTSLLSHGLDRTRLEEFYGRPLLEADRELVEQNIEKVLESAREEDVALLVVGDPFGATTHTDLMIRAKEMGIRTNVVHNASILSAIGCCGLQLYNFGATVSIPMWTEQWKPDSFIDKILLNRRNGMHTLCLLDIKTKEQSVENMMKGNKVYEPPRFLTCTQAAVQILAALDRRKNEADTSNRNGLDENDSVVGLARVGWDDQKILFCPLKQMALPEMADHLGPPLHSLIIPAPDLHPLELEMLKQFMPDDKNL